jgi:hypothetical protein
MITNRLHPGCAVAACALLAGCAMPLQPVADFGGAANALATSYKPFVAGLGESCALRLRYVALGNAGPYDDDGAERAAERDCAPLKAEAATAALFGQALSDYASALAKLAGTKPNVFDGEIRGLSGAAAALQDREGSRLFDSHQLAAATRLARGAAAMVLAQRERRLARATLADNQEALATVVDAMKNFAVAVYAAQLRDTREVMQGELGRLVAASTAPTQADVESRLPWRFAQASARGELAANALEARRVRAFAAGADALLAAHAALVADFDRLGGAQRLALVADFVNQVQAMRDDAAAL